MLDLYENAEDSPMSWQHYTSTDSTRTQHSARLGRRTATLEMEICCITDSVSFDRLHCGAKRLKVAKRFFELLQLNANGKVDVVQNEWNGDILMKYKHG